MNPKKCPKCGESNPPEAVMCWACYTPLTGAAGGASAPSPTKSAASGDNKKAALPSWAIPTLVTLVIIGGVVGGYMYFTRPPEYELPKIPVAPPRPVPPGTQPAPTDTNITLVQPPNITTGTVAPNVPVAPPPRAGTYSVVAAANPRYSVGTMAIVPSSPMSDPTAAAALAVYARQQMMRNKRWTILLIYVFANRNAGLAFKRYQTSRGGAPLYPRDFQRLANLWPDTLVCYAFNRGAESILIPSNNPNSWWTAQPVWRKAIQ